MTVAADPDPYFALPSLYGAPAYARAPKAIPDSERPLNPDDLPITAEQTEEERLLAQMLQASGSHLHGSSLGPPGAAYGSVATGSGSRAPSDGDRDAVGGRHFILRALTERLGPRPK
jgi:hypothetical protein